MPHSAVTETTLRVLLKRQPLGKDFCQKLRNAISRAFQGYLLSTTTFAAVPVWISSGSSYGTKYRVWNKESEVPLGWRYPNIRLLKCSLKLNAIKVQFHSCISHTASAPGPHGASSCCGGPHEPRACPPSRSAPQRPVPHWRFLRRSQSPSQRPQRAQRKNMHPYYAHGTKNPERPSTGRVSCPSGHSSRAPKAPERCLL